MSTRGTGSVYRPTYRDKKTGELKQSQKYWLSYSVNGEPRREPSGTTNKSHAIALLRQRNGEAVTGKIPSVAMQKTTLHELGELVKSAYIREQNTSIPRMERACRALEAYFGKACPVRQIDHSRIKAYVDHRLADGKAHATVKYELAILRHGFRLAAADGLALVPAFPKIEVDNARQGFFEEADLEKILIHLPHYLQPVMKFSALTGWRTRSEVLTLQWGQVDFQHGLIHLSGDHTKNGKPRVFPFLDHPQVAEIIQAQAAIRGECAFVFHRNGHQIKDYYTAWRSARKRAGLPDRLVHDFRRTAIRNYRRAGIPEQTAMRLSGHETRDVFDRYDIHNEEDLRAAVRRVAGTPETTIQELQRQLAEKSAEVVRLQVELADMRQQLAQHTKFLQSQPPTTMDVLDGQSAKILISGAGDRDRTGTGLLSPRDFKSLASAYSATPAKGGF